MNRLILSVVLACCASFLMAQDFARVASHFFDPSHPESAVPYVGSTLEPEVVPTDPEAAVEPLVIRLDGVDCTTLVEYVAAALLADAAAPNPQDMLFTHYLQALRYRGGVRGNYASRKHYFSEWIADAEEQELLTEVTASLPSAVAMKRPINFMSQNVKYYPQLQACRRLLSEVQEAERKLSAQTTYYIPSAQIEKAYSKLRHGDIVAFVTDTKGLDVQHVGFVWCPDPAAHAPQLFHASTTAKAVTIDPTTLQDYSMRVKNCIGIRIIRLMKD